MNRYRVRLNGKNFLLNLQDNPQKFGFYTTRDVEAESFEEAETKAVGNIREDETLKNNILNDDSDSTVIYVAEIKVLESDEEVITNFGFTFYREENEPA
jgi:hypothetical protein